MPQISRFFGIVIAMFYNEHNPPHFHAKYQEYEAEFDIKTLEILAGELPRRAIALVLEWASEHREELLEEWQLAREGRELLKIKPLE